MAGEKAFLGAILLSSLAHAAALAAGWTAIAPAGISGGDWACAFTVGSICETGPTAPSSAAFVPAPPPGAGERESSRESAREEDRDRERKMRAEAIAPDARIAAAADPSPGRKEEARNASPPAVLASLPSAGNDGRASQAGGGGRDEYLSLIRRRIAKQKRFPAEALNEGRRGTALVAFTLLADGSVAGVRVVRSSSSPILDAEAGMTVHRAAPFPPPPSRFGPSPLDLRVPISFEIERR